ncbi:hypothetical protein ABHZ07_19685, partial [Bacteroides uniformis]
KGALLNVLRGQNRLVLGGSLHWIFQHSFSGINNSSKLFFKLHLYCFSPFSVFLIVCSHM